MLFLNFGEPSIANFQAIVRVAVGEEEEKNLHIVGFRPWCLSAVLYCSFHGPILTRPMMRAHGR